MDVTIRRVERDCWKTLRDVRLAALADAPSAFGSSLAEEVGRPDAHWIDRARRSSAGPDVATFMAWRGDRVVGLVSGFRVEAGDIELVSMWTAPEARRLGVGGDLVSAVIDWAAVAPAAAVELWVTRGNEPAFRLYRSCGFGETGDHQPLPSDPCKDEIRMRLEQPLA